MDLTRREFLVATSAGVTGAVWTPRAFGRQQPTPPPSPVAPPPPVLTALRGDVGIFTMQGGTIGWLIAPDGVVVVDAQLGPAAAAALQEITARARTKTIDVLFNTHHHYDHTGGNSVFRPATRKIVAHANVPALQKKGARPGTEADQVVADTTFTRDWSMQVGKENVSAVHYGPAHTAGDSVVTFGRANVVHVGDLVFNRRMPVTDRPGGCQIAGWIAVLDRIANDHPADALYVFGHTKQGLRETGSRADVLLQRDFLAALLEHVRAELKAGKSKEQIVKAAPQLQHFPEHGALTERVLTAALDELTGVPA